MINVYIKRAKRLIDKEQDLLTREQKLKEERIALDKEERDFVQELEDMGLQSVSLTDGTTLSIKENYHCSINKNLVDQDNVAAWLRENGAEDLVQSELRVDAKYKDSLLVPFNESISMNTTKVKAWVKSQLGITGGHQNLEFKDLPKGLHFFIDKELHLS